MLPIEFFKENDVFVAGTTRRVDISDVSAPYAGFSLCTYTGDDDSHTMECRHCLADVLRIPSENIIAPRQTHSANVLVYKGGECVIEDVDAIVCDTPGFAIGINTADCVPLLFVDSDARVIGAAHAGWRGALSGIVSGTVAKMKSLGANPERIEVFIGACIHVECFEVGEEVAAQFPHDCVSRDYGDKPHVDLVRAVLLELLAAGIRDANIVVVKDCTHCNTHLYFSARRLGVRSGRNFTFIMLK